MQMEKQEKKLVTTICKLVSCYNEFATEEYYHYYMGYLLALNHLGYDVQIIKNETLKFNGVEYNIEEVAENA